MAASQTSHVATDTARQAELACRLRSAGTERGGKSFTLVPGARDIDVPEDYHSNTSGGG